MGSLPDTLFIWFALCVNELVKLTPEALGLMNCDLTFYKKNIGTCVLYDCHNGFLCYTV